MRAFGCVEPGTASTQFGLEALRASGTAIAELADNLKAPATLYPEAIEAFLAPRPELELVTVLARAGDDVVGAAHLTRQRRAGVWSFDKPGTLGEPWGVLAARPEIRQQLARAIQAEVTGAGPRWTLSLPDFEADDPLPDEVTSLLGGVRTTETYPSAQVMFEPGQPLNAYLSRNTRSAVAKARNRITHERLDYRLSWTGDAEKIIDSLDEIVDIRRERNEQMGRAPHVGLADRQEVETFRGVIAGHARGGRARLVDVRIGSRMAAYAVCFVVSDVMWVYSNCVSPLFVRYSAGTITNAEVVRAAHADPSVRVLNWGAGLQRYKLSGHATVVDGMTVNAWSSHAVRRLVRLRQFARGCWVNRALGRPVR